MAVQEDYLKKMSPTVHFIQGALGAAVLYPAAGNKAILFGLSVVLIDIDHFIEYYTYIRRLDIRGMFRYHRWQLNNLEGRLGLNIFHTMECYLIVFLLGKFFPVANFILMGFLFHHLFDEIQLIHLGKPFARAFSIAEYLIRKKYFYTPLDKVGGKTGGNRN